VTVRYRALSGGRFYAVRVTIGDPGNTDQPSASSAPATPGDAAAPPPPGGLPRALPLIVVVGLAALAWGLALRSAGRRSRTMLTLAEPFRDDKRKTTREPAAKGSA
jgi:hypothetical protein